MSSFLIKGDVGQLEAILDESKQSGQEPSFIAVVCHPHPLFEGTMHNKVAYMLARTLVQAGGVVLRFNFRGVGLSEGEHADGIGEVGDVIAAMAYLESRFPGLPMTLAGFSFGSYVALRTVQDQELIKRFDIQRLITVAPPAGRWDFSSIAAPQLPYLIIQGGQDELVDAAEVELWSAAMKPRPDMRVIQNADHFFHGKLTELKDQLLEWLQQ